MSGTDTRAELVADLRRVAGLLRSAPPARLERRGDDVRTLLQRIADAAAGTVARAGSEPPAARAVPRLPDEALGDQLAVLGAELVAAITDLGAGELVWGEGGRSTVGDVVGALAADLRALRLEL